MATIADEALLKHVWKKQIRPSLRALKFDSFNLVPDPIHYAGYEWGLDALVAALSRDLRLGRYSTERAEIVRMAKGSGLSRPLCFLATRDALVYRTITWLVQDQLVANSPEWVGFTHSDKGGAQSESDAEDRGRASFDWFRFWLARQGYIQKIMDDDEVTHIVESDIANFYPSIRLEAIREHLHSNTDLAKEVVRLCVQIIDGVMPRQDYSEVSLMGLPQEQIGSSRAIAHSLLQHVDEEFEKEGKKGRYTRFMDDILIGVTSPEAGERCISRLQRSLESLGLYPNAAKTMVIPVEKHLANAMVETNAEVERLSAALEKCSSAGVPHVIIAPDDTVKEILELSEMHRGLEVRPRRWGRVTRRIYKLHRQAGILDWWQHWRRDIETDPGSAAHILEYVRAWPLSADTTADLVQLGISFSSLYADISILAAETIATAPVPKNEALWSTIYDTCRSEFARLLAFSSQATEFERLAAAWLVSGWKFANQSQRRHLLLQIPDTSDAMSPVRAQALPLLVCAGDSLSEWVAAKPGLAWADALAAEYLRSLHDGEERAVGVALSLIKPALRLAPQRFTMLPRALPLVEILGRKASPKLNATAPRILKELQRNPDRLRDHCVESFISRWCP